MHVLRMESCLDLPHKSKELLSWTIACAHVVMTVALQSRVVNLIMKEVEDGDCCSVLLSGRFELDFVDREDRGRASADESASRGLGAADGSDGGIAGADAWAHSHAL